LIIYCTVNYFNFNAKSKNDFFAFIFSLKQGLKQDWSEDGEVNQGILITHFQL